MLLAILRYIPSAVADLVADLLAFTLAPVAALPVFITKGEDGRERLPWFFKWISTHDAPIDLYVYHENGQANHFYLRRFTPEQIRTSGWLRYVCRVSWIWRNPAYQVAHWLGYDQKGVPPAVDRFKDPYWGTGKPNSSFWRVKNHKGQTGFLYQRQLYYHKNRCVEMQFGWKLYRNDPDERCMLALRLTPFKRYG